MVLAGCDAPSARLREAPRADVKRPPAATPDPPPLPEDEAAGKRAEAQWREHLAEEEDERQLGFDFRHLREHRQVVRLLATARRRLEAARSVKAVERAQGEMARRCAEIEKRIERLDPWGNNSRLHADYRALIALLQGPLADSKRSALAGDEAPLRDASGRFDAHLRRIDEWLEEAEEEGDERH